MVVGPEKVLRCLYNVQCSKVSEVHQIHQIWVDSRCYSLHMNGVTGTIVGDFTR